MLNGLTNAQIISLLKTNSLGCKQACREIIRRPNDFIPLLLDILDKTIFETDSLEEGNQHIPAAMLLAQFKEPQVYPRLVKLISYDEDSVDLLWGDIITELYVHMLRDTYNGDSSLLKNLIENRLVSSLSRSMALLAWGMHYFDGHISREEIVNYYRRLIHEVYTGKPDSDDESVLSYIADSAREQQLEELIEDVKTIYSRNGIDMMLCGTNEEYVADFNNPLYLAKDEHIDNTVKELEKWKWFSPPEEGEDDDDYGLPDIQTGRNDPCPCGSGKKYKHCCLQ
jgi:hypothetical protein